MTLNNFIFTTVWPVKYYRHIAFWIAQCLLWTVWAGIFYGNNLIEWVAWTFHFQGFFILHILYTYAIAYYILPKYLLKRKLFKFGIWVLVLTIPAYLLFVLNLLGSDILINFTKDKSIILNTWYFSMNFVSQGPPTICAMFLTFKMLKNYYLKIEEKITLTKENANAELQLLKAQVHPHFLFNTLNNIYSFALTKSPQAPNLVLSLSNTLSYMINDCDAEFVPLEKEIKMLNDYIELEKVRYGNRLNLQLTIEGDYENKLVAPLLMIPFVENCFKHGASKMLQSPWIQLLINAKENILYFSLSNSKAPETNLIPNKNGIGLTNVKKRLELLYPGNYQLSIEPTENTFSVKMQVPLQTINESISF